MDHPLGGTIAVTPTGETAEPSRVVGPAKKLAATPLINLGGNEDQQAFRYSVSVIPVLRWAEFGFRYSYMKRFGIRFSLLLCYAVRNSVFVIPTSV